MSTPPKTRGGGLTAFRLSDIPEGIRLRGKDVALKQEDSLMKRVEIGLAAERPSQRVYWIPTPAYERVMLRKNRRHP